MPNPRPFGLDRLLVGLNWAVRRPLGVALGLALLVTLPTLFAPLMIDDFLHQTMLKKWMIDGAESRKLADPYGLLNLFSFNAGHATAATLRDAGQLPWWTVDHLELRFWRPLSSAFALLDIYLWPNRLQLSHAHSVAWYLAVVAGAKFVLWELGHDDDSVSSRLLLLTLLIFSVHPSHLIPIIWLANRNALLATAFGFFSFYFYLRFLRTQATRDSYFSLLCTALALLSAEFSLSSLAYLLVFALVGNRRTITKRFRALSGHVFLVCLWAAQYSYQGFGARGSGFYLHPYEEFASFLLSAPRRFVSLTGDLLGFLPAETALRTDAQILVWVHGLVLLAGTLALSRWFIRTLPSGEGSTLYLLSGGALLGLVPTLATFPASRLLLPASLASSYFFALCLRFCWRRAEHARSYSSLLVLGVARHILLVPLSFVVLSIAIAQASQGVIQLAQDLPHQIHHRSDTPLRIFILNSTDPSISLTLPATVAYLHPERAALFHWQFVTSISQEIEWSRPSDNSIVFSHPKAEGLLSGLSGQLFRPLDGGIHVNLKKGQVLVFEGYKVHVEALDSATGTQPSRLRFEFPKSATAPNHRFLYWDGKSLKAQAPPPIGQSETLTWQQGPFSM